MTTATTPDFDQDTVYALARSAGTLYAARASGLYCTSDEGATWRNLFATLAMSQPQTAAAVAAAGGSVFAGVNGAVLRSDDAGESWHVAGLSSPPPLVVALAASPHFSEDGVILAGTAEDGVFVSTDRGMNWTPWNFGLVDLHVYAVAISPGFSRDGTVFAGTESGIFRSQTGGRGWRETPFPMEAAPVLSLEVSPAYETDGRIYAGTERSGLFVSDDSGMTWSPVSHEAITTPVNAIRASAEEVWLLLEDSLLWSADGGRSWQPHRQFMPGGRTGMALVLDAPGAAAVGFGDGTILHVR